MQRRLSLTGFSYLVTWWIIFTAPRSKGSSYVLLMIIILFTVPVSNAKPERMFSKLKLVKPNFLCSLGVKGLENILRFMAEGSSRETFDPISAIKQWSKITIIQFFLVARWTVYSYFALKDFNFLSKCVAFSYTHT